VRRNLVPRGKARKDFHQFENGCIGFCDFYLLVPRFFGINPIDLRIPHHLIPDRTIARMPTLMAAGNFAHRTTISPSMATCASDSASGVLPRCDFSGLKGGLFEPCTTH
jgi:hypothetical protein